ncbi:Serine protease family s33, partial [Globisporangium splendens]
MSSAAGKTTLLFAHAAGFCPQVWDPVIRRLRAAPLLRQRIASKSLEFLSITAPYHATRSDNKSAALAVVNLENPASPRVTHPFNRWVDIVSEDVFEQIQQLDIRSGDAGTRSPLIGIGHSMGANALWKAEVTHPGTFDGLILFEPPYTFDTPEHLRSMDFLTSITLQREAKWSTREAAVAHFESNRNFAAWDRETVRSILDGVIVPDEDDNNNSWTLACHPHIEASVYSGPWLMLRDDEFAKPKCRVIFENGGRTKLFDREFFAAVEAKYPNRYRVETPIPNASHLMVLEDPASAATKILEALPEFPPFQGKSVA